MYSLPNIWIIKSRRIRWVGDVVHMGNRRSIYGLLVGRPDGKRPLRRPRCRWSIILKWIFKKWDGEALIGFSGTVEGQLAG